MYKDKNKQREANRQAKARQRAKSASVIPCDSRFKVIPEDTPIVIPCEAEPITDTDKVLPSRLEHEEHYHQVHCNAPSHVRQFAKGVSCSCRKRGKDIKTFKDLPPDVQQTIDKMCRIDNNKIDATAKANRTAIAIHYQHIFPGRY